MFNFIELDDTCINLDMVIDFEFDNNNLEIIFNTINPKCDFSIYYDSASSYSFAKDRLLSLIKERGIK